MDPLICPLCRDVLPVPDPDASLVPCAACGVSVVNPSASLDVSAGDAPGSPGEIRIDLSPEFVARYRIECRIGAGGMGTVFRAQDRSLGRAVAIKFLAQVQAPRAVDRFLREGKVMASISHPGVVKVYDAGECQGIPYLVAELVEGGGLDAWISRTGPAPLDEALRLFFPLLEGLQACHQEGILHRDLKPANILLDRDGRPKIADLGLAVDRSPDSTQRSITQEGMLVGTIRYLAPEVLSGGDESPTSDLYAMGLILYEMLEGKPLHPKVPLPELIMLKHEPVTRPGDAIAALPPRVVAAVLAPLEPDPRRRPASAAAWMHELRRATGRATEDEATSTGVRVGAGLAAVPAGVPVRRSRATWIGGGSLALGILGVTFLMNSRQEPAPLPRSLTPSAPAPELRGKDGMLMRLVPGGRFRRREDLRHSSAPSREVELDPYYMDVFEVTNLHFNRFLVAEGRPPHRPGVASRETLLDNRPVIGVTWEEADAYCRWAGKTLPTEAQWEFAARGTDGRPFPWGTEWPGKKPPCNLKDRRWKVANHPWPDAKQRFAADPDDGFDSTSPPGAFPEGVSPWGLHDLAGNAAEWCQDWFEGSYARAPLRNPPGPATGSQRVVRGGSFKDPLEELHSGLRGAAEPGVRRAQLGFRCVVCLDSSALR